MKVERPLYEHIAGAIVARQNCIESGNDEWKRRHEENLNRLADLLPSGSGIDCGTAIDWDESNENRIVLHCSYHHMHESGMYDGWTEHKIVAKPHLLFGVVLTIGGRNRNDIKDYLYDIYNECLREEITLED